MGAKNDRHFANDRSLQAIPQDGGPRPPEHDRSRAWRIWVGWPEWSGQNHDHQDSYERSPANRGDGRGIWSRLAQTLPRRLHSNRLRVGEPADAGVDDRRVLHELPKTILSKMGRWACSGAATPVRTSA